MLTLSLPRIDPGPVLRLMDRIVCEALRTLRRAWLGVPWPHLLGFSTEAVLTNPGAALLPSARSPSMDNSNETEAEKPWITRAAEAVTADVKEAARRTAVEQVSSALQDAFILAASAGAKGRERKVLAEGMKTFFASPLGTASWKVMLGSVIPLLPVEKLGVMGPALGILAKEARVQGIATGMVLLSDQVLNPMRRALFSLQDSVELQAVLKEASSALEGEAAVGEKVPAK